MFTKEDMATMSGAELETAREMNAAEAAGRDVFEDGPAGTSEGAIEAPAPAPAAEAAATETEEEVVDTAAESAAEAPAAAPAPAAEAPAPAAEAPAPAAEEAVASDAPQFQVEETKDITAKRTELRAQRDAIETKWSAGEITDEERHAEVGKIETQLDDLLIQQTRATTLREINEQTRVTEENKVLDSLRAEGKAAGVDYADLKIARQFDRALDALAEDPDFAKKPYAARAAEAHRTVLALNGKLAPAPAPAPAPATAAAPAAAATPAAPRVRPPGPATLRDLPAAEASNTGDDLSAQWAAATGPAAEALWNKMSPAQQERCLAGA